jgi:hypothetical protein
VAIVTRTLALALGLILTAAAAAAQQNPSTSVLGLPSGIANVTNGSPGAAQKSGIPGGSFPQAADTQKTPDASPGMRYYSNRYESGEALPRSKR